MVGSFTLKLFKAGRSTLIVQIIQPKANIISFRRELQNDTDYVSEEQTKTERKEEVKGKKFIDIDYTL